MLSLIIILIIAGMVACKKNHAPVRDTNSNKARLTQLTDSLTSVYNNTVEGNKPGNYSIGARTNLKAALDLAAQVESGPYTQEEVNNAYFNLVQAGLQFSTKFIQEVSVE